jgi:uncharacterized protein
VDRPFLDANVLYSAGYKETSPLRKLWALPDTELLTSSYAADEARCNLAVDRPTQIESLEKLLDAMLIVAAPSEQSALPATVDLPEKDRPILLAAIESGATHLLTGDKVHFGKYFGQTLGGVLILRPGEYLTTRGC